MVVFTLSTQDLAETWFGYSPLQETVFSLRARRFPGLHPEHLRWLDRTRDVYARLDTDLLEALVTDQRWIPDFLTPRPAGPISDIAEEFAGLRAVPRETVTAQIAEAYAGAPLPPILRRDPGVLLPAIVDTLEEYWTTCLAGWWPRIRSVLEADLVHRARRLALGGAKALFEDLDPRVGWDAGALTLTYPFQVPTQSVRVAGRGLTLVPSLFVRGAVNYIGEHEPPSICYPARGRATVWAEPPPAVSGALTELIGHPRARLLAMLETPATTTELAYRLGVTPGAVSRHLTALHRARLLNRARSGRSVLYVRSPLGDELYG